MTTKTDLLRDRIAEAKRRLPLPELFARLGIETKANGKPRRNPLRGDDKSMSFSVFERDGNHGWKDHGSDLGGDEITFLEAFRRCSRADAIREYLALAGIGEEVTSNPTKTAPKTAAEKRKPAKPSGPPFDWPSAVSALDDHRLDKLATWRGLDPDFVRWLRDRRLVGVIGGNYALPLHDDDGSVIGAHVRLGTGKKGRWLYQPEGLGVHPLIIGPRTASMMLAFESQWDGLAFMQALGWHREEPDDLAVLITRGQSNGALVVAPSAPRSKTCIGIVQNDEAGAKWLACIGETFPGDVRVIRPPEGVKDFADWLTAEPALDVRSLITEAEPLARPTKEPSPSPSASITPPDASPLDTLAEKYRLHWLDGSDRFFRRAPSGDRFLEGGAGDIRRKLKTDGFSSKNAEGETASAIDRLLVHVQERRHVDWAGSLAGYRAGVYAMHGKSILVRDSPVIIEPKDGDFPVILAYLEGLLNVPDYGLRQIATFYGWAKVAYESIRTGNHRPGQALGIVGPSDAGKTFLQRHLITPLLGGREANPAPWLNGRTDFNSELAASEHGLIEDMANGLDIRSREVFGEQVKNFVISDVERVHKKGRDAVTLSLFRRLTISANDNPERSKVLPPVSSDLKDKLILLLAQASPFPMPAGTDEERRAFAATIRAELPAFCAFLLGFTIPPDLRSRRFGVIAFQHPAILAELNEGEPESVLLAIIDQRIFDDRPDYIWRGSALEVQQKLTEDGPGATEARRLLHYSTACGVYLGRLADRHPERVQKAKRTGKARGGWVIHPPPPET